MLLQKIANLSNVMKAIRNKGYHIIDVRRDEEFIAGAIPTAIHVPLADIEKNPEILLKFKDKPILFYCKAGVRSSAATKIGESLKMNVENYKGSWDEYNETKKK